MSEWKIAAFERYTERPGGSPDDYDENARDDFMAGIEAAEKHHTDKVCGLSLEKISPDDWTCPKCGHQSPVRAFDLFEAGRSSNEEIAALEAENAELRKLADLIANHRRTPNPACALEAAEKLALEILEKFEKEKEGCTSTEEK